MGKKNILWEIETLIILTFLFGFAGFSFSSFSPFFFFFFLPSLVSSVKKCLRIALTAFIPLKNLESDSFSWER